MFKEIGKINVSFVGKTVLLLTYDFEAIIEFIVVGKMDSNKAGIINYIHQYCNYQRYISAL